MSVYPNQTNATLTDSYFAAAGSGGGGGTPSNWSSYPALSTITYSGAGGIANLTTVNALTSVSTPSLLVSSINNAAYPPGGGGTPSNWSSYPALSAITYSDGGGEANFTTVSAVTSLSTPTVYASQVTTANLSTETINGSAYPPASGLIVGTLPIPADSTTVTTETIAGITTNSIIIGTLTSSSACQIVSLTPGSNEFTIDVTPGAPSATRFNYVIYPAAT
jgi:hypothetical protein